MIDGCGIMVENKKKKKTTKLGFQKEL
jgi:hypothetical protein